MMNRDLLIFLIGVPLPILVLLFIFWILSPYSWSNPKRGGGHGGGGGGHMGGGWSGGHMSGGGWSGGRMMGHVACGPATTSSASEPSSKIEGGFQAMR